MNFTNYSSNESDSSHDFDYLDYDLGSSNSNTEWFFKFIPSLIIYTITFMLGFFGNLLVIFSILYLKKLQSITNLFLLSLATADLLLIVICVPIKITEFFTHSWIFGMFMCRVFHFMQNFTAICSIINLTMMSLERYLAILHPLRAKYTCTRKRAKIIIFFIWILSFLAALPVVIGKQAVKIGKYDQVYICMRVWTSLSWKLFEIYRSSIVLVLPFLIMLFTYSKICVKLWRMPTSRQKLTETVSRQTIKSDQQYLDKKDNMEMQEKDSMFNQIQVKKVCVKANTIRSDDNSTRKQIVKMLICIIAIFFISWAPITINNLLISFGVIPNVNVGILWYLRLVFFLMSYINSCINPIVYTFMSKNFREGFKQIFSSFLCHDKKHLSSNKTDLIRDKYLQKENLKSCGMNSVNENRSSESQELKRSLICGTPKTQLSICL